MNLLPLSYQLANLSPENLKKIQKPEYSYQKGWSCGVEKFNGKPDFSKGSFYANPLTDLAFAQKEGYINNNCSNVWPEEDLKELKQNFINLGKLMINVGLQLTKHIDKHIKSQCENYEDNKLYNIINNQEATIGRLLHYYPSVQDQQFDEEWCGWHNDHSVLTCLTSAIFQDKIGNIINNPCKTSGLYIKNNFNDEIIKANIPQDMIGFQIGESAQILSGGVIEATPHSVVQGQGLKDTGISRSVLAVFMSPKYDVEMKVPKGVDPQIVINKGTSKNIPSLKNRWDPDNDTYFTFSSKTLQSYN